jgi:TfoX/Sxy family transcriptional regulator of competence genes
VDADALFERIVSRFRDDPAVTPPGEGRKFGASGLKVDNKLFAMVSKGELVVKLPRERVDELIAEGKGTRFDPGHGRLMKEWASVVPRHGRSWPKLAQEARDFVATVVRG